MLRYFLATLLVVMIPASALGEESIPGRWSGDIALAREAVDLRKNGGAPTGATANVIFFLTLPDSGIVIRVPVQRTLIANADELPRRNGIEPEVPVRETATDYFAGRDRVLEVAKEKLGL